MSEVVGADLGPSTSGVSDPRVVGVASTRPGRRAPRRRPSGAAPPLPRALRRTGVGWLVGAVVAIVVTVLIYRNGVRGAAITVIVIDNTVVRWMSDIDVPGINGMARSVSYAASWWVIEVTVWLLTVALIVFRRWRLLVIYLVVSQIAVFVHDRLYVLTTQPRPFGVAAAGELGRLVAAVDPHALPCRTVGYRPLHVGARGAASQSTEVGGGGGGHACLVGAPPSRRRLVGRDPGRRHHRRQLCGDLLPLLRTERGIPGDLPPGADRAPRRRGTAR